ncbi:MAG: hypothetical protein JEY94_05925 [Melioribacteraceae bacterium]|nr:hypothetical protein [Melioribacteraceae bacterium]
MFTFNYIDLGSISLYIIVIVSLGFYFKKKSSKSIQDYFLGANKLPWWAMGISGMSSFLDMAGTMLIVSFLYMLGPRGLYIEFRGGAVLILTFMLLWSGKWHYRSKCMTGAEWMIYRFGECWGGQFARIISSIAVIITTIGMLAYLIKALGLFMSMFLPFPPSVCALIMISIATVYTIISGFYGVVYTDLFQSVIIITTIIIISVLALTKIAQIDDIALLAEKVTGNSEWIKSSIKMEVSMPAGYEAYSDLFLLASFYFIRNMLTGISSDGADPKYFGARSERECGTLTFLWTSLMMFRWPMMMGFAVLGIIMVNNFFPDQAVLNEAANFIKMYNPEITLQNWPENISNIINNYDKFPIEFITRLESILQNDWQTKLQLISFNGTVNTENIVPAVLLFNIPAGLKGFFFVAFVASALSTFNASVNKTAGYFTRDIFQRYLTTNATNKQLLTATYSFIAVLVFLGYILAYQVESINQIWGWIVMGLGGGLAIPSALKFYWWRYNGGGYAIGTTTGIITAVIEIINFPEHTEWERFLIISIISLAATIIGTFLTKPTDKKVIDNFYKTTRPFGFWKPFKNKLAPEVKKQMVREHKFEILSVPFVLGWQVSLFLIPMQLMINSYHDLGITSVIFIICLICIYMLWYRNLPPKI